jgi:hypothetical protein
MDAIKTEPSNEKVLSTLDNVGRIGQNPELKAILSLRNFNSILEQHYSEIMQIESETDKMNVQSLELGAANCDATQLWKWQDALQEFNAAVVAVNAVLNTLKQKTVQRERSDSAALWQTFEFQLNNLRAAYASLEALGQEILPQDSQLNWKQNICNFEAKVLPLIVSYGNACRIELKMIERFSPEELDQVTQIMVEHIPENFSLAEADQYEKDYLSALRNFKKEFSKKKNLWDRFLDVLAGGDHQSPSEHVMMSRWLDGEKGDEL